MKKKPMPSVSCSRLHSRRVARFAASPSRAVAGTNLHSVIIASISTLFSAMQEIPSFGMLQGFGGRVRHGLSRDSVSGFTKGLTRPVEPLPCKPHPAGGWIEGRVAQLALGETSKGRKRRPAAVPVVEDGHGTRKDGHWTRRAGRV